jgi:hypothetical protein
MQQYVFVGWKHALLTVLINQNTIAFNKLQHFLKWMQEIIYNVQIAVRKINERY